jgi:hypothetical protein
VLQGMNSSSRRHQNIAVDVRLIAAITATCRRWCRTGNSAKISITG